MSNSIKAILLAAAAAASAATMHNIIRYITVEEGIHAFEAAFFRNFFGLIILLPIFAKQGLSLLKTDKLSLHIGRSIINAVALLCWFSALTFISVGDATAVSLIGPVFVALLAILFLGEKIGIRRWTGIGLALLGAIVVVRPGLIDINTGTWLVLSATLLVSNSKIIAKYLSGYDSPATIVAYVTILMIPLTLLPAIFVWQWPTFEQLLWLAAIGVCGTTGHLLFTNAYKLADVSLVDPIGFMRLIWGACIGYFLFSEFPDVYTWIGAGIIVLGTTYMAQRDKVRGTKRLPNDSEV